MGVLEESIALDDSTSSQSKDEQKLILLNEDLCVGEVCLEEDDVTPGEQSAFKRGEDDEYIGRVTRGGLDTPPSSSSRRVSRNSFPGVASSARASRYLLPNKRREVGERGRREKVFECPGSE